MKKIYHLSNCGTCQRIISEVGDTSDFKLINIKETNILEKDLDFVAEKLGGYEAVFSKRAMKYRSMGLNEMTLTEADYKRYILEEYTFLKRPVFIIGKDVFAGNSKKVVAAIAKRISDD
jgi:arsenate reductase